MQRETESEEIGFVSYAVVGESNPQGWVFSTGSTVYVCNSRDKFHDYRPVNRKQHVVLLDGTKVNVSGIGLVTLTFTSGKKVTLTDVVHIPTMVTNFVSVGNFTRQGFVFISENGKGMIYKDKKFVGNGCFRRGILLLNVDNDNPEASTT